MKAKATKSLPVDGYPGPGFLQGLGVRETPGSFYRWNLFSEQKDTTSHQPPPRLLQRCSQRGRSRFNTHLTINDHFLTSANIVKGPQVANRELAP